MPDRSDIDPIALALCGVVVSLLNKLEEKGFFTNLEIRDLLDMALASLETAGLSGPNQEQARRYLDELIATFSPSRRS